MSPARRTNIASIVNPLILFPLSEGVRGVANRAVGARGKRLPLLKAGLGKFYLRGRVDRLPSEKATAPAIGAEIK